MSGLGLSRKLTSRKFLLALLGTVLTFVATALGWEIPWESILVVAAYIGGEGAVDAVRVIREHKANGGA